MNRILRALGLAVLMGGAVALAGCSDSSNLLPGSWEPANPATTATIELRDDGTIHEVITATTALVSCKGVMTIDGATWSASGGSVTFAGTSACTGQLTCDQNAPPSTCTTLGFDGKALAPTTCDFELGDSGDTLTFGGCSGNHIPVPTVMKRKR